MSRETYKRSTDDLPDERTDLYFPVHDPDAAACLAEVGVVVLKAALRPTETFSLRANTKFLLGVHLPVRVGRIALEKVVGGVEHIAARNTSKPLRRSLPKVLQRRPLQITDRHWKRAFTQDAQAAIAHVSNILDEVQAHSEIRELYPDGPHEINTLLLSRTPTNEWFAEHQDSLNTRGVAGIAQLDKTTWLVRPSITGHAGEDFCFGTDSGDLVLLKERANPVPHPDQLILGYGFDSYVLDGSLAHTGHNTSGHTRHSMSFFSNQYPLA